MYKYDMSADKVGSRREKKVSIKGVLVKRPEPTTYREGMDMLSMVVSIIGRTCFAMVSHLGS